MTDDKEEMWQQELDKDREVFFDNGGEDGRKKESWAIPRKFCEWIDGEELCNRTGRKPLKPCNRETCEIKVTQPTTSEATSHLARLLSLSAKVKEKNTKDFMNYFLAEFNKEKEWFLEHHEDEQPTTEATKEIECLKAEVERLKPFEPQIISMNIENCRVDARIAMAKDFLKIITWSFKDYLDSEKAENYLLIDLNTADEPLERYSVELRRPGKPSSHMKRREAEAEVERLKTQLQQLQDATHLADKPQQPSNDKVIMMIEERLKRRKDIYAQHLTEAGIQELKFVLKILREQKDKVV